MLGSLARKLSSLVPPTAGAEAALRPFATAADWFGASGRAGRRTWAGNGRLHIEVRGLDRSDELAGDLAAAAEAIAEVEWAQVNAAQGRLVVQPRDGGCDAEALLAVIEAAEAAHGFAAEAFGTDGRDHPGDVEPLQRATAGLVADVAGLGLAVGGRLARFPPVPVEAASVVSAVDNIPQLRRLLERNVGPAVTDMTLALTNAAAQGLAQGPLSLVLDGAHRAGLVAEVRARRRAWERREPELCGEPARAVAAVTPSEPRPVPLPPDAAQRYADRTWMGSLAAFGLGLALTRNPRRASDTALATLPKAARLGPEAFAAQVGRVLAERGVLPLDGRALRLLDRIDTIVIDAAAVLTDEVELGDVVALVAGDDAQVRRRIESLFSPLAPATTRRRNGWRLKPVTEEDRLPRGAPTRVRRLQAAATHVLGLWHGEELVGLAAVVPQLPREVRELTLAAHDADLDVLVAGRVGAVARRLEATRLPAGSRLAGAVRKLQLDGRVVAVLSDRNGAALAAADCGIGLLTPAGTVPWSADLLCGPGLFEVRLLIEAMTRARLVTRRSVFLALGGSGLGTLLAVAMGDGRAGNRALAAVNTAALAAVAAGMWEGLQLSWVPRPTVRDRTPWHAMPADEVLRRLAASPDGVDESEVPERAPDDGDHGHSPMGLGRALLDELANPLTPALVLGATLSSMVGSAADAALVAGVISMNGLIGGVQRLQTDRAVRRLEHRSTTPVRVRRGGREVDIDSTALVPGDVLVIRAGEPVPADCRILEAASLEADESSLTGESLPVRKDSAPSAAASVAERRSMLYAGTSVSAGEATAVVVAVGTATEAGQGFDIAEGGPPASGVERRMAELTRSAMPAAFIGGAGVLAAGLLHRRPFADLLATGVNLAVAAVPEGLPFVATVAQLGAARRLSERAALVRNPRTIEALGRVDMLCFDKTGTLTEGRITLQLVHCDDEAWHLDTLPDHARRVLAAGLRASPDPGDVELTHATDRAVVEGGRTAGVRADEGVEQWWRSAELAFEPSRGYHAVGGKRAGGGVLSVKGAPEVVLPRCTTRRMPDGSGSLDGADDVVDELARHGYRVLAVAERSLEKPVDSVEEEDVADLEFLGFLALADPVRTTAAAAVRGLNEAGVSTAMITGDHPSTAEAIAAELGILNGGRIERARDAGSELRIERARDAGSELRIERGRDAGSGTGRIVTGAQLDELDDAELAEILPGATVYARVTPAHKVRIVQALQRSGRTVAMTGDGANDAPAIRLADVGVAFTGAGGAAAARQVADLVVTDGRIETLIDAIVEGRAMWSSVRDALSILLGGNLGEIGFTVLGTALGGRSPLNPRQILLVNLATDLLPAMAIAMRPPRDTSPETLLREGPEASLGGPLRRDITVRAVATTAGATAAWLVARATGRPRRAQTVGLIALVGTQLGQTLSSGGTSPVVVGTTALSLGALAAVVQTPGVSRFMGCTPIGPVGWSLALGSAAAATAAAWAAPRVHAWVAPRATGQPYDEPS